ncbi:MAG TPA: hypothetical protein VHT24_16770, partial [Pseudacidobacterium sp.]|nr:hypothetical protein [Pseudacidobacterium sp.]
MIIPVTRFLSTFKQQAVTDNLENPLLESRLTLQHYPVLISSPERSAVIGIAPEKSLSWKKKPC